MVLFLGSTAQDIKQLTAALLEHRWGKSKKCIINFDVILYSIQSITLVRLDWNI